MSSRIISAAVFALLTAGAIAQPARAATGDLLGTVSLPSATSSHGGAFDGTYYVTPRTPESATLDIYAPPAGGNGTATLVGSKQLVGASDGVTPVVVSAIAWDPSRGAFWLAGGDGAGDHDIWLADIGDRTSGGVALAAFQFKTGTGGTNTVTGLEWDPIEDSLFFVPNGSRYVRQFGLGSDGMTSGTLLRTIEPRGSAGTPLFFLAGVTVSASGELVVGKLAGEIVVVDRSTGSFVRAISNGAGVLGDLQCDAATYAPMAAILARDAGSRSYLAFEVEPGFCGAAPPPEAEVVEAHVDILPGNCANPHNPNRRGLVAVAVLGTADLDVTKIDIGSIDLAGAHSVRAGFDDVGDPADCEAGPDGVLDLVLRFDAQELGLGAMPAGRRERVELELSGLVRTEAGDVAIVGTDEVRIVGAGGRRR